MVKKFTGIVRKSKLEYVAVCSGMFFTGGTDGMIGVPPNDL